MIEILKKGLYFLCFVGLLAQSIQAQDVVTTLVANGPGDTIQLINSVLTESGDATESPGPRSSGCDHHSEFGEHISEVFDTDLNKHVFQFDIHVDEDNDRCQNFSRQRNEIKTFNPSPPVLKAAQGELVSYNWKFKLDAGFQPSNNFTHIFQLKASGPNGSDQNQPTLTLTPRSGGSSGNMELIFNPTTGNGTKDQKVVDGNDLANFLGKWLEVTCLTYVNGDSGEIAQNADGVFDVFKKPGSLNFVIKEVATGNELMNYSNDDIDLLREDTNFNRPKWGIYRSLASKELLRDESVFFADFTITEIDQSDEVIEPPINDVVPAIGASPPTYQLFDNTTLKNPEGSVISVNDAVKNATLEVFDFSGKKLLSSTSNSIDVSSLNDGIYILSVTTDTDYAVFKIQKQ